MTVFFLRRFPAGWKRIDTTAKLANAVSVQLLSETFIIRQVFGNIMILISTSKILQTFFLSAILVKTVKIILILILSELLH